MRDAVREGFLERLRSESNIVSVVSDYVPLKRKGRNYWGCCPFHQEKTPSFSVSEDKGFFFCFGCQSGGDVFQFLMKVENITFPEAVKLLAEKLHIPMPEQERSPQELEREKARQAQFQVNMLARDFFHSCLTKTNYGKEAREYLKRRGITDETIEKFQLGFAPPQWDKLVSALTRRGIAEASLLEAGLAQERSRGGLYDRFRNRLMFPIWDYQGRVIGFGGRVLDDSHPKYLNSPETTLFNKRHVLYAYHLAAPTIKQGKQAVVVEGYMDAIAAHQAGFSQVVASLGTAFTPQQAKQLARVTTEMLFAYDSDNAGQEAILRALHTVKDCGAVVKVVALPDGKDPDEFLRRHGEDEFKQLLQDALPLLEFHLRYALRKQDTGTLAGKVAVVSEMASLLATADSAVEADAYIRKMAEMLEIDETAIRAEVKKSSGNTSGRVGRAIVVNKQSRNAEQEALRLLLRFILEEESLISYVEAQLPEEDLEDPVWRDFFSALYMQQRQGEGSLQRWLYSLQEKQQSLISGIALQPLPEGDRISFVDDCIRTMHIAALRRRYEQHRLRADELERLGDSRFLQELAESQRIKHEIDQLHANAFTR